MSAVLKSGELFAGVHGLGMAVDEVFGSESEWLCEVDAAPSRVLAHRYPDVPNYGDVTKVDFGAVPHTHIRAGKPAAWTRWVLDALGYDPAVDEVHDLFPGSGAVTAAADGMLSLAGAEER